MNGGGADIEPRGEIQVIFGPMFSGKSTELIRRVRRLAIAQWSCLVIKYAQDTRYSCDSLATHDHNHMPAVSVAKLSHVLNLALSFSVIGIDEGQFFPDIVQFCETLANDGKTVIVAALDGNFLRTGFNDILNLVPFAESVTKLNAVCMLCFGTASFTKRIGNETALEVIGGADKYIASCRKCHPKRLETPPPPPPPLGASCRVNLNSLSPSKRRKGEVQLQQLNNNVQDKENCCSP